MRLKPKKCKKIREMKSGYLKRRRDQMGIAFGFIQSKVNEFPVRNCRDIDRGSLLLPTIISAREYYPCTNEGAKAY